MPLSRRQILYSKGVAAVLAAGGNPRADGAAVVAAMRAASFDGISGPVQVGSSAHNVYPTHKTICRIFLSFCFVWIASAQ